MQCTKCGRQNDTNSKFCLSCGAPLVAPIAPVTNLDWITTKEGKFIIQNIEVKKKDWVVKKLVQKFKMTQPDADYYYESMKAIVIEYKKSPEYRKKMAKDGIRNMVVGIIFCVGGILVTIFSYTSASPGGTYYIFYGAVIGGFADFIGGIIQWSKYSKPLAESPTPVYFPPAAPNLPPVYTPLAIPNPTPQIVAEIPAPKAYQPAIVVPETVTVLPITARLIMPDMSEKVLPREETSYGRHDFEKSMPTVNLNYVSRQHFKIKAEAGRYFITDNSSNGTKLNGKDIKGAGYQELKNNDQINIADMMVFIFKSDSRA